MADVIPNEDQPVDSLHKTGKALLSELRKIADEDPNQIIDALVDAAEEPEVRQYIKTEMARLPVTVMTIKAKFDSVKLTLRLFDSHKYRKLDGNGVPGVERIAPLEPKWDVFREEFNQLIAQSQKGASIGASIAREYRKKILDMVGDLECPVSEVVEELEAYMKDIDKAAKKSADLSQGFEKVRLEIVTFKADMRSAMGEAVENMSKELLLVSNQIDEINKQIQHWSSVSKPAAEMTASALGPLGNAVGGVFGVIATLTPIGWASLLGRGLFSRKRAAQQAAQQASQQAAAKAEWEKAQTKIQELRKELEAAQKRQKEIREKQETLKELQTYFTNAENDIDECANKLVTLSRIWKIFSDDAEELKHNIEKIRSIPTSSGMKRQVKMIDEMYKILQTNLETYATQIALSP